MKILFYGRLADAIAREVDMDVDEPCTVGAIRELLARDHAKAAAVLMSERSRAVVDGAMSDDSRPVEGSATVEFLPPVSGG